MQTLTTLQELKIDFFQMTQTAHGQRRSMFTFQRTHIASAQRASDSDDRQSVGNFELTVGAFNM